MAVTDHPRPGAEATDTDVSRSWRLEARDQGAGRLAAGEDPLPGLQTAASLPCPHVVFPEFEFSIVSPYKDADPTEPGPRPYDLICLSDFLRGSVSRHSHTGG